MKAYPVISLTLQIAKGADKQVYCLKLACHDPYEPGDWLMVQPENPEPIVQKVLKALSLTGAEMLTLRRYGEEVTAYEALKYHLEITQLDPAVLHRLQREEGIGPWPDRQAMIAYAQGKNLLDYLCDYPEVRALGMKLLSKLSPLVPRYYSIASSALASPGEVHLLFRVVERDVCGQRYEGATTSMMAHLKPGEQVKGRLQWNKNFKLPTDAACPIIMIGPGVGLAPFMGFIAHRAAQKVTGENWLFFGETHRDKTFLCRDQLEAWVEQGVLKLSTAFSRDQTEKIYVQHRLREHADEVRAWVEKGAYIYLCGDKHRMAPDVLAALEEILGKSCLAALKAEKRLQMDVF